MSGERYAPAALRSMTGFARAGGMRGPLAWQWEVRSVNGRGLDLRVRLAPGHEALEGPVRERIAKRITRGSLSVTLNVTRATGTSEVRLNEAVLEQVIAAADRVRARVGGEPARVEGLLALRGVLEVVEAAESEDEEQQRASAMLASLEEALIAMTRSREEEGRRLGAVLADQLGAITSLVARAEALPSRSPEAIRQRLTEQLARILETSNALDPQRLHQEAALLAVRADIEEELKRLHSHLAGAREMLAGKGPQGRKLDFLAQEFNREANTLCSKANDVELTRIGLDLKAVIDQMREQVQNIE